MKTLFFLLILFYLPFSLEANHSQDSLSYQYLQQEKAFIKRKMLDSALFYQDKLEQVADNDRSFLHIIESYRVLGHLLEESGSFEQSLALYRKGLALAEKYNDPVQASKMLIDMSQGYRIFHHFDLALKYGKEALEVLGKDKLLLQRVEAESMIAAAFTEIGRLDSALHYHLQSISYLPQLDSSVLKANMVNLGYAYMELGELGPCKFWTEQGLKYYRPTGNAYSLGSIYTNLAMYGNRANELDYALMMFDSAIYYTKKSKYIETMFWIYEERAEVYRKLKKYDLAIQDLQSLISVKDSVFVVQRDQTTQDMEAKYQTEKKEQQIANQLLLLAEEKAVNQRNSILILTLVLALVMIVVLVLLFRSRLSKKQQKLLHEKDLESKTIELNAVISSQESERKRYATDLHDGFGQMISILKLNIESLRNKKSNKEERLEIFEKTSQLLDEMFDELRGICFNLMPQTLVRSGLMEALLELSNRINISGQVQMEVIQFGMEERLADLQEISLYRMIQEWINNILKYGDATSITVQLTRDAQEITLTIEDNGMGFDSTKLTHSKGNGWKNMLSRANLIKGAIELDTTPGQRGSTFIFNAPVEVATTAIRVSTD